MDLIAVAKGLMQAQKNSFDSYYVTFYREKVLPICGNSHKLSRNFTWFLVKFPASRDFPQFPGTRYALLFSF